MAKRNVVYLDVATGDAEKARELVATRYPGLQLVELPHQDLRNGGWRGQIRTFRSLQGRSLVFYFERLADSKQLEIIPWLGLLHGCHETAVVDSGADWLVFRRRDWTWMLPKALLGLCADAAVFLFSLLYLKFWTMQSTPAPKSTRGSAGVAYLFPFPLTAVLAGGAQSHIRGFLGGLAANHSLCRLFSGTQLPTHDFPLELIPARRKFYVFWESAMLSYNFRFAAHVRHSLKNQRPSLLYQRHGRFCIAGALLSRRLGVPLVLEYNGSEVWMADHWDPTRFRTWLRLCEEAILRSASLIVVVSEQSRNELLARGIPWQRVLVNPNAVDPDYFHPRCGGELIRKELGIPSDQVVVGFVGTFSQWHGVAELQEAIMRLVQGERVGRLTFLLVGQGPLHSGMREALKFHQAIGQVIFTGLVPHETVRQYLDATDILVSPHVPMPDGRPFFGSPTKLFEYMAMGKGIVASNLDQLAQVLEHNVTAHMVQPGNVEELVEGIRWLANNRDMRMALGAAARIAAIEHHSWSQNSRAVLERAGVEVRPAVSPFTPVPSQSRAERSTA